MRETGAWKVFVGRNKNQAVEVCDGNFVDQLVGFGGVELGAEAFVNLERVADKIVDFLGGVRSGPQAPLARFDNGLVGLAKNLVGPIIGLILAVLQDLIEELSGKDTRQDGGDEENERRHDEGEFCAQPELHSEGLLRFGTLPSCENETHRIRKTILAEQLECSTVRRGRTGVGRKSAKETGIRGV